MKKQALRKDLLREIRNSLGRFLSILLIVALGVSLFVGIRATEPDMLLSGDTYADENNLMDIKIVSTMGMTDEDVEALMNLTCVKDVEESYSTDVLCAVGENSEVLHVMSMTERMNYVEVTEGRLPEKAYECLVDKEFLENSGYKVGDILSFESGTDDKLTDTLAGRKYVIVGAGSTALYFSSDRGSSQIGNGTVSGFAVVRPEAFKLDIYTELYVTVEGAFNEITFTDEYESLIEKAIDEVEGIQDVRCQARRDEIVKEAQEEIEDARKELKEEREEAETEIRDAEAEITENEAEILENEAEILESEEALSEKEAELLETEEEVIETERELLDTEEELLESEEELLENEEEVLEKEKLLESQEEVMGSSEALETSKQEIAATKQIIDESKQDIEAGKTEIADGKQEIEKAKAEIADGKKEIEDAKIEIAEAWQEIEEAKIEIAEAKQEVSEAWEELEEKITDAEKEITDAEEDVQEIEYPEWYVFDRNTIPEYTGYGDNAARIASLSVVFPSLFFFVAALISLTTMTRMVEEQRVQIGTMKALGYSKFDIIKKYLYYALTATLSGSVLGVLIGEKLFPYVIITAYHFTVYPDITEVLIPYRWGIGVAATLIAVMCTGIAAISSCYSELTSQPAILMRPEAPKIGKKTLIEKITFLWKYLNFSWKSSLRNLFRYKKRFFMTLFGIGGCMGLLMVGYGLRDSIASISEYQYGELQLYDCSVFLDEDMEAAEREALDTYLEKEDNVLNYMNVTMESVTTQKGHEEVDAYLTVLGDQEQIDDFFLFRDRKSKEVYTLNDEGVIISEKTATMLEAEVGDEILLTEDGKNGKSVTISNICENYFGHYVYMTETMYREVYGNDSSENNILVKADCDLTQQEVEAIGEKVLDFDDILYVQYTENTVQSLNGMLVALDRIMVVLIIVAGLLSFVVLYNLNNINITERRRELATLKVLGFFPMEVGMYVFRENILLTLLGVFVGCGMGKFLHLFTIKTVEVDQAMFGREISLESYVTCAMFTIIFSIIVNWIMYFKLKKINMVESLKSVE